MATTYLLPCTCGKPVRVVPRQAGDRVRCECGAEVEVPPLSKMRQLEEADPETAARAFSWGFREGVVTACLLICVAFASFGGLVWSQEPPPPRPFSAEAWGAQAEKDIEGLTPLGIWRVWNLRYRPLTTEPLEEMLDPNQAAREQWGGFLRITRLACFGLAGLAGAIGLGSAAVLGSGKG